MGKTDSPTPRLLDTKTARQVIEAGGVTAATIEAVGAGFFVTFRMATGGASTLANKTGKQARRWRDLARAAAYVRELGIARFTVDMERYQPGQKEIAA